MQARIVIEVFRTEGYGQLVLFHHIGGIGEKEVGVGFQMYPSSISQETPVALHEEGGRKAFARILHLRIAEGEPDFLYFSFAEEPVDDLDVRTKESDVGESFVESLLGTLVHTGTLDVNPDEVHVGIEPRQPYGVLSLSASQLQHNRVLVMKILFAPMAFHVERNVLNDGIGILEDVGERLHFCEFL